LSGKPGLEILDREETFEQAIICARMEWSLLMNNRGTLETVLGSLECRDDFIWDAHVHLWARPFEAYEDADLVLQEEDAVERELEEFYSAGGRVVVEYSPLDFHRSLETVMRISSRSKVAVLVGTGFYRSPGLDVFLRRNSDVDIYDFIRNEALYGEKQTGVRPSFLKWSTSLDKITAAELMSLNYICRLHRETGLPVVTHTQRGNLAMEQIELLEKNGVDLSRVLIAHLDMKQPLLEQFFLPALGKGVCVSLDQLGKAKYGTDQSKVEMIKKLCAAGYSDRIHLGTDIGRRSDLRIHGGNGSYGHIPCTFIPLLRQMGVEQALIRKLTNYNPCEFFRKNLSTNDPLTAR
jgi:predicted metal-dependent phosphotriesterase family hydrolase